MSTLQHVVDVLAPLTPRIAALDLTDPDAARAALTAAWSASEIAAVRAVLEAAHQDGALTPRQGVPGLTYGRVAKATDTTAGLSIDAVDMDCVGPEHTHPHGEVSLCFATEGDPRFDGYPEGWVVLPPGSHHAPTVTGGRMLIVYFLPDGAVAWGPRAS